MRLADKIKFALMRSIRSHAYDVVIPNYFVGRFEMDVFKLSRGGVLTEYEIKISRSDFFADFEKGKSRYAFMGVGTKHKEMETGSCSANRFFYVTPKGLIKEEEIPKYAGLLEYESGYSFNCIKVAPTLHKQKYSGKELVNKLAFRCNNLDGKLRNNNYKVQDLEKRVELLKSVIRQLDPKNIQLFY
jgi:hypothetical protein